MFELIPTFIVVDQLRPLVSADARALAELRKNSKFLEEKAEEAHDPVHATLLWALSIKMKADVEFEIISRN